MLSDKDRQFILDFVEKTNKVVKDSADANLAEMKKYVDERVAAGAVARPKTEEFDALRGSSENREVGSPDKGYDVKFSLNFKEYMTLDEVTRRTTAINNAICPILDQFGVKSGHLIVRPVLKAAPPSLEDDDGVV